MMLRTMCLLRGPLKGLMSTLVRQQGSLARAFVQVDDVTHLQPEESSVEKDTTSVLENPCGNAQDKYKRHLVYKFETPNRIHVNLEELSPEIQTVFVNMYLEELKESLAANDLKSISFNNINEDVFRYHLNMPIRKQNFDSSFQRYNDDKGLASFMRKAEATTIVGFKPVASTITGYRAVGKAIRKPKVV